MQLIQRASHLLFLAAVLALALALLTACGGGGQSQPSPTPSPSPVVRVAVDASLGERPFAVADELLEARAGPRTQRVSDPGAADLAIVTAKPTEEAFSFVVRRWAPVTALPNRASELTMSQLRDIVLGNLTYWRTISGEPTARPLITLADPKPSFEQWWPDVDARVQTRQMPLASILTAVATEPGALALLPLDAVDARVRSLGIEDDVIVFGVGSPSSYGLTELAWVVVRDSGDDELAQLLREMARDLALRLDERPPDPIILRATGDLGLVRCTYAKQRAFNDFRRAFSEIGPWLAEADITIGSSDFSISDAGQPIGCVETFSLLAPPQTVEGYTYAGIDLVTIAANHVKDCGDRGFCGDKPFFDTIDNLHKAGVMTVGGGANLAEARRPGILTVKGVRFAFLGYDEIGTHVFAGPSSPGTAPLEEEYVRADIAAAVEEADVVVIMPQWGVEYTADPTLRQRRMARVAVEAGADLIVDNGAHWVAAAEVIDRAFVAYALGNFVYDQDWSIPTQQGAVLEAAFHGPKLVGVRFHPTRILDRHLVVFPEPAEARQILDRIWDASAALD